MKAPIITLKNVKTFIGREGYGFNATLYVDGIKTAFAFDDASGGGTDYDVFDKVKFQEVNDYAKSLPKEPKYGLDMCLDFLVDDIINEMEKQKALKKMEKKFVNSLVWGIAGSNKYTMVSWKCNLSQLPTDKLQETINKYRATFKQGEVFFNNNFQSLNVK